MLALVAIMRRALIGLALACNLLAGRAEATDCMRRPELQTISPGEIYAARLPAQRNEQVTEVAVSRREDGGHWAPSHTVELADAFRWDGPSAMAISDAGWLVAVENWCWGDGPLAVVFDSEGAFRYRIETDVLPVEYLQGGWGHQVEISYHSPPFTRGVGAEEEAVITLRNEHRAVVKLRTSEVSVEEVPELTDPPRLLARVSTLMTSWGAGGCDHDGDSYEAARLLGRVLKIEPGNLDATLWLGTLLLRECARGAAFALLESAVIDRPWPQESEPGPEHLRTRMTLASALAEAGRRDEATALLEELSALLPADDQVADALSEAYLAAGAVREAADVVWAQVENSSSSEWSRSIAASRAGSRFLHMKLWNQAELAFQIALDAGYLDWHGETNRAEAIWCGGRAAEAAAILESVLQNEALPDGWRERVEASLDGGFSCRGVFLAPWRSGLTEKPVAIVETPSISPGEAEDLLADLADGELDRGSERAHVLAQVDASTGDPSELEDLVLRGLLDPSSTVQAAAMRLAGTASLGGPDILQAAHAAVDEASSLKLQNVYIADQTPAGLSEIDHSVCFAEILDGPPGPVEQAD